MLIQLPKEILFTVLSFLTFQDKLALVKTSRHLRHVISERHLYEQLPTFKSESKLHQALDTFSVYPVYSSQVKRLNTIIHPIPLPVLIRLPLVFPNIKEFSTIDTPSNMKESDIEILLKWKDTLELLHIKGDRQCIAHILNYHLFPRLSSLVMALPYTFLHKYERDTSHHVEGPVTQSNDEESSLSTQENNDFAYQMRMMARQSAILCTNRNFQFFDCFKNTPSLSHLELHGGYVYVEYLEKLHTVCPQLTSLSLSSLNLYVGDINALPSSIEPAIQLHSLKLDKNTSIHNFKNGVLDYLAAKYTNLTELMIQSRDLDDRPNNFSIHDLEYDFTDEYCSIKRSEFISNLPSTIKILKLNTYIFTDPIGALEESPLDLTELEIYTSTINDELAPVCVVAHPKQLDYFKNLDSLQSLTLEWNNVLDEYKDGPISNSISSLTVLIRERNFLNIRMHLDNILLSYPSLKYLVLKQTDASLNRVAPITIKDPSSMAVYPNLKSISLYQPFIDPSVVNFIRTSLTGLKELELKFLYPPLDADVVIDINGRSLDILHLIFDTFIPIGSHLTLYLQIRTLNVLESYIVTMVDSLEIRSITQLKDNGLTRKAIKIVCGNIKTLNINGMDTKPFLKT